MLPALNFNSMCRWEFLPHISIYVWEQRVALVMESIEERSKFTYQETLKNNELFILFL